MYTDGLLSLLGELDLETCDDDELEEAQDYLLECLAWQRWEEENGWDDPGAFEEGLWDYSMIMQDYMPESKLAPQPQPLSILGHGNHWVPILDGDRRATALYNRHYSARKGRKARLFIGPGEKLALLTPRADALFAWRLEKYRDDENYGANCTVFRNESAILSSELILHAEAHATRRWPWLPRFFTFVDPGKVRSKNPGCCFQKAGWRRTGETTSKGLLVFEKLHIPAVFHEPWQRMK